MFLRVVRATVSNGLKREYVRVVEAYRDQAGKTQHRTVLNLGRKDLLAAHLDLTKLRRLLHGEEKTDCVKREDVGAIAAWDWGPMLVAHATWRALGLDTMLNEHAGRERRDAAGLSDRALVLVANRLLSPGSEHALAQWLESDFVCDQHGRRFIAAWRDDAERKASRTPLFIVHSDERAAFEQAQRVKAMGRVRTSLEKLAQRIQKGRLKAPEKVGAAAGRILIRNHGHRYYGWCYEDGVFRFFEHPVHFVREQAYEGKYVIQTEEPNLSAVEAVRLYKELSEVERAFANLKDVIDLRPIYHRTDDRVQAHIFVAALAFLLHRAIEKKLKAAGLDLSATQAPHRPQIRARCRNRSR